jgi:hypothetical protein
MPEGALWIKLLTIFTGEICLMICAIDCHAVMSKAAGAAQFGDSESIRSKL